MVSLSQLKRQAESLEPDDGIRLSSSSEITIILENGNRIEIGSELARKIFGSADNLEKIVPILDGTESLELHNVQVSDEVWVKMDEVFAMVDEV
jgi:hypothetical protein